MRYQFRFNILLTLPLILLMVACSSETDPNQDFGNRSIKAYLTINNTSISQTRADIYDENDLWSYREFTSGDMVGFFSKTGAGDSGTAPFVNTPLLYDGTVFNTLDDQTLNPINMSAKGILIYFPFDADVAMAASSPGAGLELRVKSEPFSGMAPAENFRCLDFLTCQEIQGSALVNQGELIGAMNHAFSELIIMRGKGFDQPEDPTITVALTNGYSSIVIDPTSFATTLIYDSSNSAGLSQEQCKEWTAWKGGNFHETLQDVEGKEAWYVILPTVGSGSSMTQVDYIKIQDNEGNWQYIRDLYLSGSNGMMLEAQWRYPMQITMQELVPTVFPFTIQPWGSETITNERTRGIRQDNFQDWLSAYSTFITSGRSNETTLSQFGDKIQTDGAQPYWHFYIFDNLDLSSFSGDYVIQNLQDVLDGSTSPMKEPIKLTGLSVPFVGTMSGAADTLKNLNFDHPVLNLTSSSPAGVLVNNMSSGGINNCSVNQGSLSAGGAVGMFCGSVTSATILNSSASGIVSGISSETEGNYLFGSRNSSGSVTLLNNNSSVIFNNTSYVGN